METFCLSRGLAVDDWVSEIGGGLNFKRKKFLSKVTEVNSDLALLQLKLECSS
jgi:predicted site-specific integrase-resolvase